MFRNFIAKCTSLIDLKHAFLLKITIKVEFIFNAVVSCSNKQNWMVSTRYYINLRKLSSKNTTITDGVTLLVLVRKFKQITDKVMALQSPACG